MEGGFGIFISQSSKSSTLDFSCTLPLWPSQMSIGYHDRAFTGFNHYDNTSIRYAEIFKCRRNDNFSMKKKRDGSYFCSKTEIVGTR